MNNSCTCHGGVDWRCPVHGWDKFPNLSGRIVPPSQPAIQNLPGPWDRRKISIMTDGKIPTLISVMGRVPPSSKLEYAFTSQHLKQRTYLTISMTHEDFDEYQVETVLFNRIKAIDGVLSVAVML
jgi:hypothetical protein